MKKRDIIFNLICDILIYSILIAFVVFGIVKLLEELNIIPLIA